MHSTLKLRKTVLQNLKFLIPEKMLISRIRGFFANQKILWIPAQFPQPHFTQSAANATPHFVQNEYSAYQSCHKFYHRIKISIAFSRKGTAISFCSRVLATTRHNRQLLLHFLVSFRLLPRTAQRPIVLWARDRAMMM